jgi:NAD(P)-dependent dehydrogenase (short-subunit alcohol dehydrogenase family)
VTDAPGSRPGAARTVLVTGASSGIGRATAHLLAQQGARLVLAARAPESLEQTRQECVGRGASDVLVVPTDVRDAEAVTRLFAAAVQRFGRLDAVVQAAGVVAYGRFEDIPAEVFDGVIATNVTGAANVAREALRVFGDRGGSLVVVGSVIGKIATPYLSPYATSKWALQGLVRTLQIEARQRREVHITLVTPGGVDTPIYDLGASYTGHPGSPPPPVTTPERVAAKIVRAFDRPSRDLPAGSVNWVMVTGFRLLPGVYDRLVGPLMRLLGQGRGILEPHPGNVFEPDPTKEAVRGRWPHIWG